MQTIQLTAQVDDDGMLRVQMPEGLKPTFRTSIFTTCIGHEDSTV